MRACGSVPLPGAQSLHAQPVPRARPVTGVRPLARARISRSPVALRHTRWFSIHFVRGGLDSENRPMAQTATSLIFSDTLASLR